MVKEINTVIKNKAIYSDDSRYRYFLSRTWDEDKKKATALMLNPSYAESIKTDKTIMNLMNYLVDHGYGSLSVVNLYAYRTTDPSGLSSREHCQELLNDKYILETCKDGDIIIAWTRGKHILRKREIANLLKFYTGRLKCLRDEKGKQRHPRDISEDWELDNYSFSEIDTE